MKTKLKLLIMAAVMVLGVGSVALAAPDVMAQNAIDAACESDPGASICQEGTVGSVEQIVQTVINVLLFIVGLVSVVMIIISGIRYTTSGGDSGAVTGAKNTLLYSVIGLVVAFLAYAIVNFVLTSFQ
ncbi:MAG TPA: pilin [Candidatus Saccharimonadaceae bacterium]|nr:pilin [Candidatus Saccharimonadaceae bacterium]